MTATTIMQRKPGRPSRAPASLPDLYPVEVPRSEPPARTFFGELDHREALYMGTAHVLVWSWCRREREPTLFDAAEARGLERDVAEASLPRDLSRALVLLARRLGKKRIDPIAVALACVEVGDCAVARGARQSALPWSEAAAAVVPWNPRFAWLAGRLHRQWSHHPQAEYWFHRAVRVAVRIKDRHVETLARNSIGNLHVLQGDYATGREHFRHAHRLATRYRLRSLEGEILHDLAFVSACMERFADAEKYGLLALRRYGTSHPNTWKLKHDLALIFSGQRSFERAIAAYEAVLPHFTLPSERVRVLASLVRSSGGNADRDRFERYWTEAWKSVQDSTVERERASTLVDMGIGAIHLKEWDRAFTALSWARQCAQAGGECDMLTTAEKALAEVRKHREPMPVNTV
ncbi:MAG TPA: tetratricopeptide repeat protein [Longimicrobium sp.]|nr:tetratricopeptide repeat protein [Longimicrobium sp.]